jgi:hypothetical protein
MPRYADAEDDWEDDESWRHGQSADEENGEPFIPCPYCRREMLEDLVRCPHCGQYISQEDAPPGPKPAWIIVGVILCLMIVLYWIVTLA